MTDRFPGRVDIFAPAPPQTIPDVITEAATNITATGATSARKRRPGCRSRRDRNRRAANSIWGLSPSNLNNTTTCDQPLPINGNEDVTRDDQGLTAGATYFFQLTAKNSDNGIVSKGKTLSFQPAGPPVDRRCLGVECAQRRSGSVGDGRSAGWQDHLPDRIRRDRSLRRHRARSRKANFPTASASRASAIRSPGSKREPFTTSGSPPTNPNDTTHGADHTFTTFPFTAILERPVPERARPAAGGRRSAARLPRL